MSYALIYKAQTSGECFQDHCSSGLSLDMFSHDAAKVPIS